jgi:hypothetical protein
VGEFAEDVTLGEERAGSLRAGFAAACRRSQFGSFGGMVLPLSDSPSQ